MKLGEQIINLHSTDFTSGEGVKVKNAAYAVAHANRKPCRVSNFSVGGTKAPQLIVAFVEDSGTYTAITDYGENTFTIEIDSDDTVTITITEPV